MLLPATAQSLTLPSSSSSVLLRSFCDDKIVFCLPPLFPSQRPLSLSLSFFSTVVEVANCWQHQCERYKLVFTIHCAKSRKAWAKKKGLKLFFLSLLKVKFCRNKPAQKCLKRFFSSLLWKVRATLDKVTISLSHS